MKQSTKQVIYILLFFGVLIAGILLSEFFDFGKSKRPSQNDTHVPGTRLEKIRKGMTKK